MFADTFTVLITPDREAGVAALVQSQARAIRGQQVTVTGAFRRRIISGAPEKGAPEFEVVFWRYDAAAGDEPPAPGRKMSIEELTTAESAPTSTVTVIGNSAAVIFSPTCHTAVENVPLTGSSRTICMRYGSPASRLKATIGG